VLRVVKHKGFTLKHAEVYGKGRCMVKGDVW